MVNCNSRNFGIVLVAAGMISSVPDQHSGLGSEFQVLSSTRQEYRVNDDYVLRAHFDGTQCDELSIEPQRFAPNARMSPQVFADFLGRIARVFPLGAVVRSGQFGPTLKTTLIVDEYSDAIVERSLAGSELRAFRVAFFRDRKGRVQDLRSPSDGIPFDDYRVQINDRWYWTSQGSFGSLRIGEEKTVRTAGPVDTQIAR